MVRRYIGIIFTLSLLPTCLPLMDERPFMILRLANRIKNVITFQCQLSTIRDPIPDAMFFLNGTRLENITELELGEDHGVSFEITRDLEGYFSCGNDSSMSNPMALIAIPYTMVRPLPQPTYAISGERVQLNCVISPGRLIEQYSVTWYRSRTIVYQSRDSPPTLDDRYSVDPFDLSLIIDNVHLEDASEEYHCSLTVTDPSINQTYTYGNLQFYDIQLRVLAHPTVDEAPQSNIISEDHNALFTCSVRGFPAPVIEWELNGVTLSSDSATNRMHQDGVSMITSSRLMITGATIEMNGEVTCIGRIPTAMTGDRVLDEANSTTTIVVYSPPYIEESKMRDSIVVEGDNTSFICCARGFPRPTVTWFLNGTRVLPQDPESEVNERSSQNGPYNVTTSTLMISSAQQKLNVEVQCLAKSTNAVIDLPDAIATAKLVVLGTFDLGVDVTQSGNILFEVTLLTPLSTPVKLTMEYIDLDNRFRRKNVTTSVAYIATTSFLHLETQVPFDRFRVSVRLTSNLTHGPAVIDINDHAKNQPTLVDPNVLDFERHKHIIWGVFAALFELLVTITILLCLYFCLRRKYKLKQMVLNDPNTVLQLYFDLIKNSETNEDCRAELIEKAGEMADRIIEYKLQQQGGLR